MIDSPPRKRDPIHLAAWLARYANDISIEPADEAMLKDASIELRRMHDAIRQAHIDGQEAMRERAAMLSEQRANYGTADAIRYLPIEGE